MLIDIGEVLRGPLTGNGYVAGFSCLLDEWMFRAPDIGVLRVCVSLLVELDSWVSILFLFLRYSVLIGILRVSVAGIGYDAGCNCRS